MTLTEMSNEFDILYNNIMSNQAPGLDEYEKSVFLTKAQNELILEYFSPKGNKFQEGFDGSERRQIDFSTLVFAKEVGATDDDTYARRDTRSKLFSIPSDALLIINEVLRFVPPQEAGVTNDNTTEGSSAKEKVLVVIPISYAEYARLMLKAYKLPQKSMAWRLLNSNNATTLNSNNETNNEDGPFAEVIYNTGAYSNYIPKYNVTYVKRPNPIILIDLSDAYSDVTIDGENNTGPMECELDPIMHHDIVQRAVELAKAAYTGDLNTQIQVGSVSATNLGVIPSQDKGDRR